MKLTFLPEYWPPIGVAKVKGKLCGVVIKHKVSIGVPWSERFTTGKAFILVDLCVEFVQPLLSVYW